MLTHAAIVLGAMVVVFAIAALLKVSIELSMLLSAVAGAIVHGAARGAAPWTWIPVRHLAEGAFTYFDVVLIFISATLFMNLLKEMGGVDYIVRGIVGRFHGSRALCLLLLTFVLLVPGALTGSGSVTVLVTGALAAKVLASMGVREDRVTAIVFLCAAMSAAAPPVNLWAMMSAAGSNMPYVGFFGPLAVLSLAGAIFSMFYLGWRGTPIDVEKTLAEIPEAPGLRWWKVALPFAVLFALIVLSRAAPFVMPTLGLPLYFVISSLFIFLVSPRRLDIVRITRETIDELLPLIGIMVVVGIFVQILALSGARGLISLGVVTLPLALIVCLLFLILPFSEGLIQYAAAPLLGVPLVLLFNMKGLDPIIALSAMSIMWPIGDMLPPTVLVGRASIMVTKYKGGYYRGFVRATLVPALFILALATVFVAFSGKLKFLSALG